MWTYKLFVELEFIGKYLYNREDEMGMEILRVYRTIQPRTIMHKTIQ